MIQKWPFNQKVNLSSCEVRRDQVMCLLSAILGRKSVIEYLDLGDITDQTEQLIAPNIPEDLIVQTRKLFKNPEDFIMEPMLLAL